MTNPDYDYTESLYIYRTCDLHHLKILYTVISLWTTWRSCFIQAPGSVSSFHDDDGNMYCAVPAFRHSDADLARDPLSTNRRLVNTEDLELFGTMVVAGATPDHIKVLIPGHL